MLFTQGQDRYVMITMSGPVTLVMIPSGCNACEALTVLPNTTGLLIHVVSCLQAIDMCTPNCLGKQNSQQNLLVIRFPT